MKRNYSDRGESGNEWLDEAWFTLAIDGQQIEDRRVEKQELYVIKDILLSRSSIHYADELAQLRAICDEVDSGEHVVVLAFPRLCDARYLMSWRRYNIAQYKYGPYPAPKTVYEVQRHELYQRFPMTAQSRVNLVIFAGEVICRHMGFRENDGPGSISTEVGLDHVAPKDWWKYGAYGFRHGLSLVRVTPDAPIYQIDENHVRQLWQEAYDKAATARKKDTRWIEPRVMNSYEEAGLPKLIEQLYRVKPGEFPQEN